MRSPSPPSEGDFGPVDPGTTVTAPAWPGLFADITPHASGALGEVFRATDAELHRTVAVKCLQDRHAGDFRSRQRFLLEAEVTARLEHPGVVPVYQLFAGAGRLAYSMRFVEGQTFAEEIAAYHAGPADPVLFRRLLQAFLQICQTVAYAHSRGVIHRDLKPANVMVGKFGETLVVDWGLAKVVGRPEEARVAGVGETLMIPPPAESGPGDTLMGSAVGTPAYMSPEQAAGRWDVVAQASDIYGLGAVLFAVLTGKPPLEHANWPEMQQKIQQGDFPRPRQVNPDVPRPSEAVCLKAMALRPQDRYPSATALAEDVEHWLAGEPVTAYREPFAARARRWGRKHRTLVGSAAVLLIAAVVGLSVGAGLLQRARVETDNQRKAAVIAQRKAEAINRFLIDDLLKQADPLNNPVGDLLTVRQLLDKAAEKVDSQARLGDQPEVEAEIRAVIGHAFEFLSVFDKAERHYRRAWELLVRLHGEDDPLSLAARNRQVWVTVIGAARPEADEMARGALERCGRILGEGHPETADAANNLAEAYMQRNRLDDSVALRRRASKILNATLGGDDTKTLAIDNDLGVAIVTAGHPEEGVTLLQSVVERCRRAHPDYAEFGGFLGNLGGALVAVGRFPEAETALKQAIPLSDARVGPNHGNSLGNRNLLGYATEGQGRWAEAETIYLGVLADRRKTSAPPRFLGRTLGGLARLHAKQERWPNAAPYLAEMMIGLNPNPARTVAGLTPPLLAAVDGTADPAAAEPLLRECRDALKLRLWAGDWLTAEVASRYGDCLRRRGKFAEARPVLAESLDATRKAIGAPAWGLAAAQKRLDDLDEASKSPRNPPP